jgi:hypothetical protein
MKPQSAKQKGRLLQQFVRDAIYAAFPSLEKGDVESTSMGAGGMDVKLSPAAKRLFPFAVECKSKQTINVYKEFEQARANANGLIPVLVIKKNRTEPLIVLDFERFMCIMKESAKIPTLYEAIAHGDEDHKKWLKDTLIKHFKST